MLSILSKRWPALSLDIDLKAPLYFRAILPCVIHCLLTDFFGTFYKDSVKVVTGRIIIFVSSFPFLKQYKRNTKPAFHYFSFFC